KNLNKKLNDLDMEKKLLEDINSTFRSKEISVDELEKAIEDLKSNNFELKKENQELSKIIDTEKAERSRLAKFEEKVSNLENNIIDLLNENEMLKQKDAILLAKTINVMEKESKEHIAPADDLKTNENNLKTKEFKIPEKSIEVVQSAELQPKNMRDFITTENIEQKPKSAEVEILSKEEGVSSKPFEDTGYRKKICPNCGNTNKAQIREIDDKTRVIYPGFYAKKYLCGQCATEWR
ncbi:MAG: hypothetical protein KGD74_10945, partial [Candidatus Lokiarchaeota archaeon]|nr:hypothetical protein [Candidatus Lokiarchaeota archaeon]